MALNWKTNKTVCKHCEGKGWAWGIDDDGERDIVDCTGLHCSAGYILEDITNAGQVGLSMTAFAYRGKDRIEALDTGGY